MTQVAASQPLENPQRPDTLNPPLAGSTLPPAGLDRSRTACPGRWRRTPLTPSGNDRATSCAPSRASSTRPSIRSRDRARIRPRRPCPLDVVAAVATRIADSDQGRGQEILDALRGTCRSSSVRAARSLKTGTSSAARRSSSSRVRVDPAIPADADFPGLTAAPCYAAPGSEGEPHRPGQEPHQRRLAPTGGGEAGGKVRGGQAWRSLNRAPEVKESRLRSSISDGRDRSRAAGASGFASSCVRASTLGHLPGARVLHDRRADRAKRVGARMPRCPRP